MTERDPSTRKRGRYIGGHDIAALVGANPWRSPADVYATMALGAPQQRQTPAMRRGSIVEPGLLSWVEETIGQPLRRDIFVIDDARPYCAGSLDGLTADGVLHEVTTCGERTRDHWGSPELGEGPSPLKRAQATYYMGLSGARAAEVWCLDLAAGDILHYRLERDEAKIAELFGVADRFFFDHVATKTPPHPDAGWAVSGDWLSLVYPGVEGKELEPTEEIVSLCREYDAHRAAAKAAKEQQDEIKDRIKGLMGDAVACRFDGGRVLLSPAGPARAEPDWMEVALSVRDACHVPAADWARIVEECTHPVAGKERRIDVRFLKGKVSR